MNNKVSVRKCKEYDLKIVTDLISNIYKSTGGPDVCGKKVLVKPNLLSDNDPSKCVSTHPVVLEAMIRFLQSMGATVFAGDSPAVHTQRFKGEKSGLVKATADAGATWVDFLVNPIERVVKSRSIRIAGIVEEVDLIISLPKFKTHELLYFTGAIKNTLGLLPGFSKAKQHAIHRDRNEFGRFMVDLNETILPDYFLMDAVMGMEGHGPGTKGKPVEIGLLIGSSNPLALDVIASRIACYEPDLIPTTRIALERKLWLRSENDIEYDGPEFETIVKKGFVKIPASSNRNIGLQFVMNRIRFTRKFQRRPYFVHNNCSGCHKCVKICPVQAIKPEQNNKKHIILTDSKCIRCFCCAEVCPDDAVDVRIKVFGV